MTSGSSPRIDHHARKSTVETALWLLVLVLLCGWTAGRLGAFDTMVQVTTGGRSLDVPNIFSSIDHPFHAARAFTLLESLEEGHFLRWVGNHQGGYPTEFYPLGVAWLEVGIWALLFGSLPILAAHKLAVILIFLIPALGFWILARTERISPGVAVLATAMHLAIPGGNNYTSWTTGGYTELVQWGLVTNVAGATAAMIATAMLISFVAGGLRSIAIWAALFAAAAAYANPRSLFAIAIAAVAVVIASALPRPGEGEPVGFLRASARIGIVGIAAVLLAMPIISPLLRYEQYYYFLHYQNYLNLGEYWTASLHAVSPAGIIFCILGGLIAILMPRFFVARAVTITLIGYVVFTGWLSVGSSGINLIQQLETPRLMPYQRLLVIYLAAFAAGWCINQITSRIRPTAYSTFIRNGALAALALIVMVVFVKPVSGMPEIYRGLEPTPLSGNAGFAEYQMAIDEADARMPVGTAILVIGTTPGEYQWHIPLFGPTLSDAPFFYNDWLWDWSELHNGTPAFNAIWSEVRAGIAGADQSAGHFYPDPANALDSSYLSAHGIGMVVVTDIGTATPNPRDAAHSNPNLTQAATYGNWDVYTVGNVVPIVTNGLNQPIAVSIKNEHITASFSEGPGDILIRRNWFPRWRATVNGEAVPIQRTADGYMSIKAPAGDAELQLTYAVTGADWVARICAVAGILILLVVGSLRWAPGRLRWLLTNASGTPPTDL
ncbi:MAG: hypothetical protein ACR2OU_09755 [Thermomicrobiales bacterium]